MEITRNVFQTLEWLEITTFSGFLGLGEEKWHRTHNYKPEGQWNSTADVMVAASIIQSFQCVGSGILEKKVGRCTIHFNVEPSNANLLFRTISSANQLGISGAIADWCDELTQQIFGSSIFKQGKIHCESD